MTNSVVVGRTNEMKMSSGRGKKGEGVSETLIDDALLTT
jgi:hypothetical protein